jgi:hypothetical protein
MAGQWSVVSGVRTITVQGSGGLPNESVGIVVSSSAKQVLKVKTQRDANGECMNLLRLPAGSYDVDVTADGSGWTSHDSAINVLDGVALLTAKLAPIVTPGQGSITVSGTGTPGEAISIVISQGGVIKKSKSGNLDASGQGTITIPLPPGTYDVEVTAGGTVYDFLDQQVT